MSFFGIKAAAAFPSVSVNLGIMVAMTLASGFVGLILAITILPFLLPSLGVWIRPFVPLVGRHGSNEPDTTDYLITVYVPEDLNRTLYIESEEDGVKIMSRTDDSFCKTYSLPEGFEFDEYHYEYEENYLLLKIRLKSRIA